MEYNGKTLEFHLCYYILLQDFDHIPPVKYANRLSSHIFTNEEILAKLNKPVF